MSDTYDTPIYEGAIEEWTTEQLRQRETGIMTVFEDLLNGAERPMLYELVEIVRELALREEL